MFLNISIYLLFFSTSQKTAEREKQVSSQVFRTLISTIQRREAELNEEINEQQKAAERRASELVKELEKEISELQRRQAALQLLEETENNHHLLQVRDKRVLHTESPMQIYHVHISVYQPFLKTGSPTLSKTLTGN